MKGQNKVFVFIGQLFEFKLHSIYV